MSPNNHPRVSPVGDGTRRRGHGARAQRAPASLVPLVVVLAAAGCLHERHLVGDGPDGGGADRLAPSDSILDTGTGGAATGGSVTPAGGGGAGGTAGASGGTVTSLGDETGGGWPVAISAEEIAVRLSRFLLRKDPSPALKAAVLASAPVTNQDVGKLTDGLLLQEASLAGRQAFYRWWLGLDAFLDVQRDAALFPGFNIDVRQALIDQALAFVEDVTWRPQGDLSTLLTEPTAFISAATAPWYPGVVPPAGSESAKVALDPTRHAGIITQPPVVAVRDYPFRAAPVARGMQVRGAYLCQWLPPAPPGERTPIPFPDQSMTIRQRLNAHAASPSCAACHVLLDPPGFAFGHFDAVGAYHDTEGGLPVDTTGQLTRTSAPDALTFDGAPELARTLATLPEVRTCFAGQWLSFATGGEAAAFNLWPGADPGTNPLLPDATYVVKRATIQGRLNLRGVIRAVTETHAFLDP